MDSKRSINKYKNQTLQHKCEIRAIVWGWNLEDHRKHHKKDTDFHQPVSKKNPPNTIARYNLQQRYIWHLTKQKPGEIEIRQRRCRWIGHSLRKQATSTTRHVLRWNPQRKRSRGRPRNTWRRDFQADMKKTGHTWNQVEAIARDRDGWRNLVGGICFWEGWKGLSQVSQNPFRYFIYLFIFLFFFGRIPVLFPLFENVLFFSRLKNAIKKSNHEV